MPYQYNHRPEYFHKIIIKRRHPLQHHRFHHHYHQIHVSFVFVFVLIKLSLKTSFLEYEDEPSSGKMSAISTVVGHRFFGPDFNIEQLRGTFFEKFSIDSMSFNNFCCCI